MIPTPALTAHGSKLPLTAVSIIMGSRTLRKLVTVHLPALI